MDAILAQALAFGDEISLTTKVQSVHLAPLEGAKFERLSTIGSGLEGSLDEHHCFLPGHRDVERVASRGGPKVQYEALAGIAPLLEEQKTFVAGHIAGHALRVARWEESLCLSLSGPRNKTPMVEPTSRPAERFDHASVRRTWLPLAEFEFRTFR
jgi:hypothetical protein